MLKSKGAVSIYSFMLYTIISLALIGVVYSVAIVPTTKYQQQNNLETMIETIQKINAEIKTVSQSIGSKSQIIVYNPQELLVDCENNRFDGKITYNQEFREDLYIIHNIKIDKKNNNLEFLFAFEDSDKINLLCGIDEEYVDSIFLSKGKNTIDISYESYNAVEDKINIRISNVDFLELDIET